MSQPQESFWTKAGVFFGIYFRCPHCQFAHDKKQVKKDAIRRRFQNDEVYDPGVFTDRTRTEMKIYVVYNLTFECPQCKDTWTEEKAEEVKYYDEPIEPPSN